MALDLVLRMRAPETAGASASAAIATVRDGTIRAVGGTLSEDGKWIEVAIQSPGVYVARSDVVRSGTGSEPRSVSIVPRSFSRTGIGEPVRIRFRLGAPGPVSVRIYTRSGRLVRTVAADRWLEAGDNLLTWDGRNADGNGVEDGLYIVSVVSKDARMSGVCTVIPCSAALS